MTEAPIVVDVDLSQVDDGAPLRISGGEDFPVELVLSKTYGRLFDAVDFNVGPPFAHGVEQDELARFSFLALAVDDDLLRVVHELVNGRLFKQRHRVAHRLRLFADVDLGLDPEFLPCRTRRIGCGEQREHDGDD